MRPSPLLPWVIWGLSALFVVFNYVQQIIPNVIAQDLSKAFRASESSLGNIAACYFYAYAVMQIPVGLIVDRFGTRRPLVIAILAAGLGQIAFSVAHTTEQSEVARVLMGASSAFSFIGCLKLVQEWFPPARFSTLAGMTNTAGMIGAAGSAPVALLVDWTGWRGTVLWLGMADLLLALLVFLLVRDQHPPVPSPDEASKEGSPSSTGIPAGAITTLLTDPQVWLNALYATGISLVFVAFGGLWGSAYLGKAYGVEGVEAAGICSLLFVGGIAGSLFFGWYSDYLGRRKLPMVMAGMGAPAAMAALLYLPNLPLSGFKGLLLLVGFFGCANIVSYAVARDLYPRLAGLSIGLLSTCFFAGGAASQPLVGKLLEHASGGNPGLASLSAADYRHAFAPLILFMLLGLAASLILKEPLDSPDSR
jgi:sugar phosphate permease